MFKSIVVTKPAALVGWCSAGCWHMPAGFESGDTGLDGQR